jgi:hypothetical protein
LWGLAQPVKDSLIFEKPMLNKEKLSYTFWREKVKCYELHMSMRQRDKDFITVLNKMRLNEQSNDDIEYINSHCYRSPPIDPLFPYLFYKNKDVQRHNEKMLSQVDEELLILEAFDEVESCQEKFPTYDKTATLPLKILVKRNILVELYVGNYNIEDMLVNCVDGAFKGYSKGKNEVDVIWIDFVDPIVGKSQRDKFHDFYDKNISPIWTPIF